jgi:hypothetical protein
MSASNEKDRRGRRLSSRSGGEHGAGRLSFEICVLAVKKLNKFDASDPDIYVP